MDIFLLFPISPPPPNSVIKNNALLFKKKNNHITFIKCKMNTYEAE